ncbi:acetyl-CoA synthetase-like protein [Cylindrobasidium torrendii FP15055 ss-10]|uniref:Acetyl-CoA synthetase-like protein n=1 Tax=Cylindrobasidium torrendii FP15055 ss-10 TaxID=1314674 RepID=A0A0D7BH77_9AGAR|nr:acetyl-CoA synthetase-like protein [Cylindrobasidium torrendii FP15055 ss-10]
MSQPSTYFAESTILRQPDDPNRTAADAFRRFVNRRHGLNLATYHDLHAYSVAETSNAFWIDLWDYLGIVSSVHPDSQRVTSSGYLDEVPIWFPDARLNYAENMLVRTDDGIAITAAGESGVVVDCSFRELREQVRRMAAAMRASGLKPGDRVAAVVRNSVLAVVLALATASIGGIFSSTATDMGTQGVLDRYEQITPKLVFAETEVLYAGKVVNLVPRITTVFERLRTKGMSVGVVLPSAVTGKPKDVFGGLPLNTFLDQDDGRPLLFEQLPFSHPLFIVYSSGTSGPPKCIVHSAGGALLNTKREAHFHYGISHNDTYFQYTSTGWIMWTILLAGLSLGSRIVCYDGSPLHPTPAAFLSFIDTQNVSHFGTSPRYLAELMGRDIKPKQWKLEALRSIVSTGAPLTASVFAWAQKAFGGERVHLFSTSGGTDACASFVSGMSSLPTYAGEIQSKCLGMAVEIFSPTGTNIESSGTPGELVCTKPHPSVPLFLWGDTPSGDKFRETYFSVWPGVWRQGDFIVANPITHGMAILGRSDGVLNPSGVRFGSAEIYSALEGFSAEVEDTLCVGQRRAQDLDESVFLFVKMRPGQKLSPGLVAHEENDWGKEEQEACSQVGVRS